MQSGKAYKSFVARIAKKKRMAEYNKPKEMDGPSGLLAKRSKSDTDVDDSDMDAVLEKYIRTVKTIIGANKDA